MERLGPLEGLPTAFDSISLHEYGTMPHLKATPDPSNILLFRRLALIFLTVRHNVQGSHGTARQHETTNTQHMLEFHPTLALFSHRIRADIPSFGNQHLVAMVPCPTHLPNTRYDS